jgi:four helix bundle protein
MALSDFLNVDLPSQAQDFTGEVHQVYQRTRLAGKNAAVDRLLRCLDGLAKNLREAKEGRSPARTNASLEKALRNLHECVPLLDLCLKKILVSPELHQRWTKWLSRMEEGIRAWAGTAETK